MRSSPLISYGHYRYVTPFIRSFSFIASIYLHTFHILHYFLPFSLSPSFLPTSIPLPSFILFFHILNTLTPLLNTLLLSFYFYFSFTFTNSSPFLPPLLFFFSVPPSLPLPPFLSQDYLPSAEEAALIKAFRGDPEMLGQAEKYMKVMTGFNSAAKRIQVTFFNIFVLYNYTYLLVYSCFLFSLLMIKSGNLLCITFFHFILCNLHFLLVFLMQYFSLLVIRCRM